jgi:hypothetical protein
MSVPGEWPGWMFSVFVALRVVDLDVFRIWRGCAVSMDVHVPHSGLKLYIPEIVVDYGHVVVKYY